MHHSRCAEKVALIAMQVTLIVVYATSPIELQVGELWVHLWVEIAAEPRAHLAALNPLWTSVRSSVAPAAPHTTGHKAAQSAVCYRVPRGLRSPELQQEIGKKAPARRGENRPAASGSCTQQPF